MSLFHPFIKAFVPECPKISGTPFAFSMRKCVLVWWVYLLSELLCLLFPVIWLQIFSLKCELGHILSLFGNAIFYLYFSILLPPASQFIVCQLDQIVIVLGVVKESVSSIITYNWANLIHSGNLRLWSCSSRWAGGAGREAGRRLQATWWGCFLFLSSGAS